MIRWSAVRAIIEAEEIARENIMYDAMAREEKRPLCADCRAEMNFVRAWSDGFVGEYYCPTCQEIKVVCD